MPLFEIETASHIIITWAEDEQAAVGVVQENYPEGAAHPHDPPPARYVGDLEVGPGNHRADAIPAPRPAIAWPKPRATRSTPSAFTCSTRAPTWNGPERRSSRTWSWGGDACATMTSKDDDSCRFWIPHGQEHLLAFWDRLDAAERASLAEADRASVDFALIGGCTRTAAELGDIRASWPSGPGRRPAVPARCGAEPLHARSRPGPRGSEALDAGQVGAILVAGGQGTRLGFDHPKGMYPDRARLRPDALPDPRREAAGRWPARHGVRIPLYLMTSPATHEETVEFFARHGRFGLPEEDLRIFCQGTMPAVDAATGRLLLEAPGRLATSPDGHGGMLAAFAASGAWRRPPPRPPALLLFPGRQPAGGRLRGGVRRLSPAGRLGDDQPGDCQAGPAGQGGQRGPGGRPAAW